MTYESTKKEIEDRAKELATEDISKTIADIKRLSAEMNAKLDAKYIELSVEEKLRLAKSIFDEVLPVLIQVAAILK